MKKLGIILILFICVLSFTDQNIKPKEVSGTYEFCKVDTLMLENDTSKFYKWHFITLKLNQDFTFTEDNENIECFANLPDYVGIYTVKDSLVICTRTGSWLNNYDTTETILSHSFDKTFEKKFIIKGDTLVNYEDSKIRLIKKQLTPK